MPKINIPLNQLIPGAYNSLSFLFPQAKQPATDPREIALSLCSLNLKQTNLWQTVQAITKDEIIPYNSAKVNYKNWETLENGFRWNHDKASDIYFYHKQNQQQFQELMLEGVSANTQSFDILLNGQSLGSQSINGEKKFRITIPQGQLKPNGYQHLHFNFPDAKPPGNGDPRNLAFALKNFAIKNTHPAKPLPMIGLREIIPHNSTKVIYKNWSEAEESHRWNDGNVADIYFRTEPPTGIFYIRYLLFEVSTFHNTYTTPASEGGDECTSVQPASQAINIKLNGVILNSGVNLKLESQKINITVDIGTRDQSLFAKNGNNHLHFDFPDAVEPANSEDSRSLAFALQNWSIVSYADPSYLTINK